MMLVTCAENDSINFLGGSILEGAGLAFDFLEEGLGLETFGPVEAHGS
jgi:hypothetical protein